MIKLGANTISALKLGTVDVQAAYLGAVQVFGSAAPALDPDAAAYITAVETADTQALEPAVQDAINDFVVGCKADGIWNAIKASCIMAGARTLAGALVPLKGTAPTNNNFVSADYNRKTGLKGDGSTKVLDSNRNNNADPQNDSHNAVFVQSGMTADSMSLIGRGGFSLGSNEISRLTSNQLLFRNRSRDTQVFAVSGGNSTGFIGSSRNSSASFVTRQNGVSNTITYTSETTLSGNVAVFSRAGSFVCDARIQFYSIGEALDLAALDTRVSALMTAIDGALP
jgi:hypothetical protein